MVSIVTTADGGKPPSYPKDPPRGTAQSMLRKQWETNGNHLLPAQETKPCFYNI